MEAHASRHRDDTDEDESKSPVEIFRDVLDTSAEQQGGVCGLEENYEIRGGLEKPGRAFTLR